MTASTAKRHRRHDYVLRISTPNLIWPGQLPYRDESTRPGRGYRTREEAEDRARRVEDHYARHGSYGFSFTVVER